MPLTPEAVRRFRLLTLQEIGRKTLRSGEIAKRAGVSVDTLRHYERMGVLATPCRQDNGYRDYSDAALQRVLLVRRALRLGFSLNELAPFLTLRDQGEAPCKSVHRLAQRKLEDIENQLADLSLLRDHMKKLLEDWDERMSGTPNGQQARLLDGLPELTPAPARNPKERLPMKPKES